ncbi:TRAP transporter large permease subunit [Candidatus Persebacteraceae bacterium Df01]|jgi:tripartite ATP-independent transporter DctM subunit|uniref:TRAP transporter large permease protein n=1 Tax=Candidatus Doriopsillibacter californiensis TaxID=2970740 RepID=A0ABT7QMI5_9GAMM|nr:TRAP transporter large permease subunit [Candidatus Persebacteraceae bacterium Df01]
MELYIALLLAVVGVCLFSGFPVAFALAGGALMVAGIGHLLGDFDTSYLGATPSRLYGIMTNETLIAVPLFVFMGLLLERGKISEGLLIAMGRLFGKMRGGLAISVCLVGAILAASTGIVGATVVTMGLISLPVMLRHHYHPALACGVITASGTLGQIIPPSIVLVILGDVISNANQKAQLSMGNFSPDTVSVGDLFFGALLPGLFLVVIYIAYIIAISLIKPDWTPAVQKEDPATTTTSVWQALVSPILLIFAVLGSILAGIATPTEAAAVGAGGAMLLAFFKKSMTPELWRDAMTQTTRITCMVFVILIGASIFSLVFRGFGGDDVVTEALKSLPGGVITAFFTVMLLMFVLGFFLDFLEIIFVVVPIVAPVLIQLGMDPIWLGVMIAVNLQTSFLTPPFGFALFYLRGVVPESVSTGTIYRGAIPFVALQILVLLALWFFPAAATWLPHKIYG